MSSRDPAGAALLAGSDPAAVDAVGVKLVDCSLDFADTTGRVAASVPDDDIWKGPTKDQHVIGTAQQLDHMDAERLAISTAVQAIEAYAVVLKAEKKRILQARSLFDQGRQGLQQASVNPPPAAARIAWSQKAALCISACEQADRIAQASVATVRSAAVELHRKLDKAADVFERGLAFSTIVTSPIRLLGGMIGGGLRQGAEIAHGLASLTAEVATDPSGLAQELGTYVAFGATPRESIDKWGAAIGGVTGYTAVAEGLRNGNADGVTGGLGAALLGGSVFDVGMRAVRALPDWLGMHVPDPDISSLGPRDATTQAAVPGGAERVPSPPPENQLGPRQMSRQEALDAFYHESTEYRARQDHMHGVLAKTNPGYSRNNLETDWNCVNACVAFDLNMRQDFSLDVIAKRAMDDPRDSIMYHGDLQSMPATGQPSAIEQLYGRPFQPVTTDELFKALEGGGPGTRGIVSIRTMTGGDGHVFMGVNLGDEKLGPAVALVDPQTGSRSAFDQLDHNLKIYFLRTDDAEIRPNAFEFVTPAPRPNAAR
ncbi:toxin glutamine deamidase domain-containing protein [Actinoplanes sp. CA-030573]|uniref:toxin glutamine deamidase domain-containing protein n=1 Tax=Actinoplanes sp. CA-030573 TaxID=3239898 RepID=UPI003D93DDA3